MGNKESESVKDIDQLHGDDQITVHSPIDNNKIITTIKAYQTIYDQITGKQQKIEKQFANDYEVTFSQLDQLNIKMAQLYKQFQIISKNCSVIVMHQNDDKEEFESYEKFSTYNTSNINPVIALVLNYNFSILCPENRQISNYLINIQISPGNTPPDSLQERFGNMHYFGPTLKVSVQYSDYVVARTFIENISDWAKSIEKGNHRKILFWMQRRSQYSSFVLKNIGISIFFAIVIFNVKKIIPLDNSTNHILFKNSLIIIAMFYTVYTFLKFLGHRIEYGIDALSNDSIILLNEGDKKLLLELKSENKKSIFKIILNFILSIIGGVLSVFITKYIFGI